jgi:hypothetical protein
MFRISIIITSLMVVLISCARFEKRAPRYDQTQCPICQAKNNGVCSYCNGTKKCMFCNGEKERLTVIPNRTAPGIKQGSFKTPCPYCNGTGICTYCEQSGKCWVCQGSGKVGTTWDFLNRKKPAEVARTQ